MGKAGLEYLLPYRTAVQIEFIDTQRRGHPPGRHDFFVVLYRRDKPTGPVRRTGIAPDTAFDDRCIDNGNPLSRIPSGRIERYHPMAHFPGFLLSASTHNA